MKRCSGFQLSLGSAAGGPSSVDRPLLLAKELVVVAVDRYPTIQPVSFFILVSDNIYASCKMREFRT